MSSPFFWTSNALAANGCRHAGGLEPSAAAVEEITAAVEAAAQPARQRPARQKVGILLRILMFACALCTPQAAGAL